MHSGRFPDSQDATGNRIVKDALGKENHFRPFVVAGALVAPETEPQLKGCGIHDSKQLSDARIAKLAPQIRALVGTSCFDEVVIGPQKYNQLHDPVQTVNAILAWGHARARENLLAKGRSAGPPWDPPLDGDRRGHPSRRARSPRSRPSRSAFAAP